LIPYLEKFLQKKKKRKKAGGVAQGVGSKFKPVPKKKTKTSKVHL
jgi:hypothetical protein